MRLIRFAVVAAASAVMVACGGSSGATPTATASSASATPAATGPPAPAQMVVWAVLQQNGVDIREVPLSGGAGRLVTSSSAGVLLAADTLHAMLVSGTQLQLVTLSTGATTPQTSGIPSDGVILGGAFSPDRRRFAYAGGTSAGGALHILDLTTGTQNAMGSFSGSMFQAPAVWTAQGITCLSEVPFSDAPPQGVVRLDAATGASLSSSAFSGGASQLVVAADGARVASSRHATGLGDETSSGPVANRNTVATLTVGAAPATIRQKASHDISAVAVDAAGDVLINDGSAAGGSAGITMSPDFGVLLLHPDGSTTQYAHFDGTTQLEGGAFTAQGKAVGGLFDGNAKVNLVLYGPSGATTLDSTAGTGVTFVAVV